MNIALVLAGGTGKRMGLEVPKQYHEVGGRPVIAYSLHTFLAHEDIDAVQIVADEMWHGYIMEQLSQMPYHEKFKGFSAPGRNRQLSIYHALTDMRQYAADTDAVVVHDAARPCVKASQITSCLEALNEHDGVLPVLPMKDTLYLSSDGVTISSLIDRSAVMAGQAPEVFLLGKYYEANRRLLPDNILKINGSTETAILAGMDIVTVAGDEGNFKITTAADMERFRKMMDERVLS